MKKYIKFLAALILTFSALKCHAADLEPITEIDLNTDTKVITVKGYNISKKFDRITYEVLKDGIEWGEEPPFENEDEDSAAMPPVVSGTKLSDFNEETESVLDYLEAFGQTKSNPGELYVFTVNGYTRDTLPKLRIRFGKGETVEFDPAALDSINGADDENVLFETIKNNAYIWNKVKDEYDSLINTAQKESIFKNVLFELKCSAEKEFKVPAEVISLVKNAIEITQIRGASDETEVQNLINYCMNYSITGSNSYDIYTGINGFDKIMSSAQKKALILYIRDNRSKYGSIAEFVKDFHEKTVLYAVKDSLSKFYLNTVFNKSDRLSGTVIDKYRLYSESKQIAVCEMIASDNKLYESIDELTAAIDKAVSVIKDSSSSGKTGGSGGGRQTGGIGKISSSDKQSADKNTYSDISDVSWAKDAIEKLTERKIVSGRGNGRFDPHAEVTREEFIKMLVGALNLTDAQAVTELEDVGKSEWYYIYVASAVKNSIVNGVGNNKFGTGKNITRQEIAALIYRAALKVNISLKNGGSVSFSDKESLAPWAFEAVAALNESGIMQGMDDNRFNPLDNASRAQAAKVIYELIKRLEGTA